MKNSTSTWFVSRHQGSIAWIKQKEIQIDHFVSHLDDSTALKSGDVVIGALPIHIIAKLNDQGIRFISFHFNVLKEQRGKELSIEDLVQLNVQMREYIVLGVDPPSLF